MNKVNSICVGDGKEREDCLLESTTRGKLRIIVHFY